MLMEMQENLNVVTLFKVPIIGILEEIDSIDQKCASWKGAKKIGKSSPPYLGNESDSIADSLIENNWLSRWQDPDNITDTGARFLVQKECIFILGERPLYFQVFLFFINRSSRNETLNIRTDCCGRAICRGLLCYGWNLWHSDNSSYGGLSIQVYIIVYYHCLYRYGIVKLIMLIQVQNALKRLWSSKGSFVSRCYINDHWQSISKGAKQRQNNSCLRHWSHPWRRSSIPQVLRSRW